MPSIPQSITKIAAEFLTGAV